MKIVVFRMINITIEGMCHVETRHAAMITKYAKVSIGWYKVILEQFLGQCGRKWMACRFLIVL